MVRVTKLGWINMCSGNIAKVHIFRPLTFNICSASYLSIVKHNNYIYKCIRRPPQNYHPIFSLNKYPVVSAALGILG